MAGVAVALRAGPGVAGPREASSSSVGPFPGWASASPVNASNPTQKARFGNILFDLHGPLRQASAGSGAPPTPRQGPRYTQGYSKRLLLITILANQRAYLNRFLLRRPGQPRAAPLPGGPSEPPTLSHQSSQAFTEQPCSQGAMNCALNGHLPQTPRCALEREPGPGYSSLTVAKE